MERIDVSLAIALGKVDCLGELSENERITHPSMPLTEGWIVGGY